MRAPNRAPRSGEACSSSDTVSAPPTIPNSIEPAKPSHDFLGLRVCTIGCLPKAAPIA